jgi:hypothetical protein
MRSGWRPAALFASCKAGTQPLKKLRVRGVQTFLHTSFRLIRRRHAPSHCSHSCTAPIWRRAFGSGTQAIGKGRAGGGGAIIGVCVPGRACPPGFPDSTVPRSGIRQFRRFDGEILNVHGAPLPFRQVGQSPVLAPFSTPSAWDVALPPTLVWGRVRKPCHRRNRGVRRRGRWPTFWDRTVFSRASRRGNLGFPAGRDLPAGKWKTLSAHWMYSTPFLPVGSTDFPFHL